MSLVRFSRGVRNLGGFAGGTSRLARPPQRLPEPDVRPRREVACFSAIEDGTSVYGGDSGDFLRWTDASDEGCVELDYPEIFVDGTQPGYVVTVHVVYASPSFPVEWQIIVQDSDAFPEVVVETHTISDSSGDLTFVAVVDPGAGDWWIRVGLTGNGSQFVEVESAEVTICCNEHCPVVVRESPPWVLPVVGFDGGNVYEHGPDGVNVWQWSDFSSQGFIDFDPAMDGLGASGAGITRAVVLAGDGRFYCAGYLNDSTLRVFGVDADGMAGNLLWSDSVSTNDCALIFWHPAAPGFVYLIAKDAADDDDATLAKVNLSTGARTLITTLPGTDTGISLSLYYDNGFVFANEIGGGDYDIWACDVTTDDVDSHTVAGLFAAGVNGDGLILWIQLSPFGLGGALQIGANAAITETTSPCADPFPGGSPFEMIQTLDRSVTYLNDSSTIWSWP